MRLDQFEESRMFHNPLTVNETSVKENEKDQVKLSPALKRPGFFMSTIPLSGRC